MTDDIATIRSRVRHGHVSTVMTSEAEAALDRVEDRLLEADSVLQTLDHLRERTEQAERERDEERDRLAVNEQFTETVCQGREASETRVRMEGERYEHLHNDYRAMLAQKVAARAEADRLREALREIAGPSPRSHRPEVEQLRDAVKWRQGVARDALAVSPAGEQA